MIQSEAYREAEEKIKVARNFGTKELSLFGMNLTELPQSLSQLVRLQSLSLGGNLLMMIPEWLGQLTKLQSLHLSHNRLTTLPQSLGQLTQLKNLYIDNNQLTALPESLTQLKLLKGLFLHNNPRLGLSFEILGPTWQQVSEGSPPATPRAILAFYFGQRQKHAKPLNEVKLLLVGHGRVGKTSLSKALRGVVHNVLEPETPGIERHLLQLLPDDNSIIKAHVWDFGGQEFLHQTHQFFFSERSIYLVVLSGRQGQPMQEAEYWLRLIRSYGQGSPVIVVLNQIKAHPFTVDEYFLRDKYPEVRTVVRTDCDPRDGTTRLKEVLVKLAGEMESVRQKIAPDWLRVRTHLEEMKDSFVTFGDYCKICVRLGVLDAEDQAILAKILNYLGIALNYRDDPRLRDTSVLKPRWLVDGIYKILRWLQRHENNGVMCSNDLRLALPDAQNYPAHMHAFLLALMEKFELCFPIEDKEGLYLVPALLDANQPSSLTQFINGRARRIQFRYEDARPPGLLPRFIVRSHTLSEEQPRWLRGVVLARGQARALVRGDHEGRVTDVYVVGDEQGDRVWLAEFILDEMRVLNDKLPVRTLVESEALPGAWTELELLRMEAKRGERTRAVWANGKPVMIQVEETLREVESPETSAPRDHPLPLFICYAHADERTVKRLVPSLKVLARRGYIAHWDDTYLVAGEDWDETIQARLLQARIILYMVSRDFLASMYINNYERPLAMRLAREGKAVVVPIMLSPCNWETEDFARLENLPRKGKTISSFKPREEAWRLVERGIQDTVTRERELANLAADDRRRREEKERRKFLDS